jgi:tetratricopeptide (TPR) repeat protein
VDKRLVKVTDLASIKVYLYTQKHRNVMFEEEDNIQINGLINRYEEMVSEETVGFFDVDQFENITDYYFETGNISEALTTTEHAISQHPFSVIFHIKRAQLLTVHDRIEEAIEEVKKAELLAPESSELKITKANIYAKKGQHEKAISTLLKALPNTEDKLEVYELIAYEYQAMGQFNKAIRYLKRVLTEDASDDIAVYNIAFCYEMLGEHQESAKFFEGLVEDNPYSELAWHQLGYSLRNSKEYEKAIEAFDYAIVIDEHFTASYHEKAKTLMALKKYPEAAESYLETLEFEEPTGFTFLKIAECFKEAGNLKEAMLYCVKATHEDPQLDEAWVESAMILDALDKTLEGVHCMKKAIELDPENPDYWYISAQFYWKVGLLGEAGLAYKQLLSLGVIESKIWLEFTELLIEQDETELALDNLYNGLEAHPEDAEMHYIAAGFFFANEFAKEGKLLLALALELDPENKHIIFDNFPQLSEDKMILDFIKSIG